MEGGIGELNPMPFQVGGGPTPTSKAYAVIRKAVGEGGSATDDRGIEGLWRRSEAHGLAAATSALERAVLQVDPELATDFLPYYERILGLVPGPGDAEAARQSEVARLWTRSIDSLIPSLAADLLAIDPRLELASLDHGFAATAQEGRAFEPHEPGLETPTYGGLGYSLYPAYASEFCLRVRFPLGHDPPLTSSELGVIARVEEFLLDALPSWVTFTISTGQWHIGVTPLGLCRLA